MLHVERFCLRCIIRIYLLSFSASNNLYFVLYLLSFSASNNLYFVLYLLSFSASNNLYCYSYIVPVAVPRVCVCVSVRSFLPPRASRPRNIGRTCSPRHGKLFICFPRMLLTAPDLQNTDTNGIHATWA